MFLEHAEPFFYYTGSKEAVLLIHGFTGSPSEMLLLGDFLRTNGYNVLGIRLAGHGTTEKDLARMKWHDWYYTVLDGYYFLQGICNKIHIIGLSMGGLLALHLASNFPVNSVISLSTPIFISSHRGMAFLPPRPLAKRLSLKKRRKHFPGLPDYYSTAYKTMPLISVHELKDCLKTVMHSMKKITAPLLIMQSKNDHTVEWHSAEYIYENAGSKEKELLLLEKSGHIMTLDCEHETVFQNIAKFLEKYHK